MLSNQAASPRHACHAAQCCFCGLCMQSAKITTRECNLCFKQRGDPDSKRGYFETHVSKNIAWSISYGDMPAVPCSIAMATGSTNSTAHLKVVHDTRNGNRLISSDKAVLVGLSSVMDSPPVRGHAQVRRMLSSAECFRPRHACC
jgi:hypothetical protein